MTDEGSVTRGSGAAGRDGRGAGVVVAMSSDVPEGGRVVVDFEGTEIGVFRVDGELRAWANSCAHVNGPVCQGKIINRVIERLDADKRSLGDDFADAVHIVCPWHGYEYDLLTGRHPGNPNIRLRGFPVTEIDGEIIVEL